jgi:hypothetical protein
VLLFGINRRRKPSAGAIVNEADPHYFYGFSPLFFSSQHKFELDDCAIPRPGIILEKYIYTVLETCGATPRDTALIVNYGCKPSPCFVLIFSCCSLAFGLWCQVVQVRLHREKRKMPVVYVVDARDFLCEDE